MTLRIGVLGAAQINRDALIKPASKRDDVVVAAVAARDPERASTYALKHDIPRVHDSYDDLLSDDSIDALYIPLPPTLHERWAVSALEAGKHVLIEKPFADTATAARSIARAADGTTHKSGHKLVAMEAFHWRYHPMARQILDIVESGEIGDLVDVSGAFRVPIPGKNNIRWSAELGGGALGDLGCYIMHQVRTITGEEPEIVSVQMRMARGVDRSTVAELRFPSGVTSTLDCSLAAAKPLASWLRITGSKGAIFAASPVLSHLGFLRVSSPRDKRFVRDWTGTTYDHQLAAFADAVSGGEAVPTGTVDAIANAEAPDRIRAAASGV